MGIVRLNELPEGSGNLTNDDIFVFMDDPSGSGITKKISLSEIGSAIGGGGGTSFVIGNINLHNGGTQSAQILQFNNNSYQSVITGPTPAENSNAQRLIIQGQKNSGVYEGGDVYLWGGDADINGGDIKIYAGDADDGSSGYGGYVNIDAGNGYNQGGNVSISAGNSSEQAGNVTITAGNSPIISGVIYLRTGGGAKEWAFNNDGAIVFPNNSTIAVGTYDNGTGGNGGISLNCGVGYELNWQGGHLKSTLIGSNTATTLHADSPLNLNEVSLTAKSSPLSINGLIHIGYEDNVEGSVENLYFTTQNVQNLGIGWKVDSGNDGILSVLNIYPHIYEGSEGTALALTPRASWPPSLGETANFYAETTLNGNGLTFPDGTTQTTAAIGGSTTVVPLVFNTTLNTDASLGDIFDVTLTDNTTLANPTNPVNGKTIRWRITQDNSGNRGVTLGDKFVIPSSASSPLPWSTTGDKMDILAATYHSGRDKWDVVAFVPGY